MTSRSPRSRTLRVALLAAFVLTVLLAVVLCDRSGEESVAPLRDGAAASASDQRTTASGPRRQRTRAVEGKSDSAETDIAGPPAEVDGWPAADVIVLHPDRRPVVGATVYVHVAGGRCDDLGAVALASTGGGGRVRVAVPGRGRYDVGAFQGGGFSTLVVDVEFPARRPVEILLPETTALEVRADGAVSPDAWVTAAPAGAERIRAFPGRGESKYAQIPTRSLPARIDVPRGVPLRISSPSDVIAEPEIVTAPGLVTLRADRRISLPVELAFVSPAPPDQPSGIHVTIESNALDAPARWSIAVVRGSFPSGRLTLRASSGPVKLVVSVEGQEPFHASVAAAPNSDGSAQRVEVPISSWTASDRSFRVRWSRNDGPPPANVQVLLGESSVLVAPDLVCPFTMSPLVPVAATASDERGLPLVVAPTMPAWGRTLDLALAPGAFVVVRLGERPAALHPAWQVTAELADRRPFVNVQRVVNRATLAGSAPELGPFPPGDYELVLRLAGTVLAKRTVHVVPGPPIEIDAPDLRPPGR